MELEPFLESLRGPLANLLDLRSQALTSYYMDLCPIQDSFRYRAKHLGLRVAQLVLDERGELNLAAIDTLAQAFDATPYLFGPDREGDATIYAHIQSCLHQLKSNQEIGRWIRKFSPPLCHKKAEEIIRETLWPEEIKSLHTIHVRKAVMASWFTLLRQATGSCFATAPAILIQKNHPIRFFKDFYDLLSTGQMKRNVAGREYSVPMSVSDGKWDLERKAPFLFASPGVVGALKAAGLHWSASIERKIRGEGLQSAEQLFKTLLMEAIGLTQEEIDDEAHLSTLQMPLIAKQTGIYYQKPSERGKKVAEWKKRVKIACTAFQSFTECPLLRSWEYTIASLCDVKLEFTRWNLYVGLGMHPSQQGGVGAFIHKILSQKIDQCQLQIERLNREYEQAVGAIQAIDAMINGSLNDERRHQLKAEATTHILNANFLSEERSRFIDQADALSKFFPSILEQYDRHLQESFQELFDPALIGDEGAHYNDSPAGFRLVYKHGRRDASLWTPIGNGEQYVDALREFFSSVEHELVFSLPKEIVSEITTDLIRYIQEPSFLTFAMQRSAEVGRKSPWHYISGGTLQSLLMAYSNRESSFKEESLVPKSPNELFHFFEQIKSKEPLLMYSPTHAFIFYPEWLEKNGAPRVQKWDEAMQEHIAHRISQKIPEEERPLFLHLLKQKGEASSNSLFRDLLLSCLGPHILRKVEIVDATLYEETPLFSLSAAKEMTQQILTALGQSASFDLEGTYFGSFDLYKIVKGILLKSIPSSLCSVDWDMKIAKIMRHFGCAPPFITLFADTNWSHWFFGFVLNPATSQLELWRLNRNGTQGFPMHDWKEWTSPSNSARWVLLSNIAEYTF
jgi:hypothetical protein